MSNFTKRGQAFEAKFAQDSEVQFRVNSRRNKILGMWAAELLGKDGKDAENYAAEVVKSDMEEAGGEDVIRKVQGDLGSLASDAEIRTKLIEALTQAKKEISAK